MANSPNEPWDDERIDELIQFDEALRLGRNPAARDQPADPAVDEAQEFLRRLQKVWQRSAQKIGPYVLVRTLGQGSLGPCYFVEDPKTRQPLVLKVLWPDLSAHPAIRQALVHEAKALSLFRHIDVAAIRDARALGAFCYVASDYCPGPTLAQWRQKHPQPIAWPVVAEWVAKLADVLEAGHRQGVVHGNLKPTNLFLPADTEVSPANLHEMPVRIADFGLASVILKAGLAGQNGLPWPMPQYLAPEQLSRQRRSTESACDVYALGVLLYELLTGRSPVKGTTREEIHAQTRQKQPTPPRQYRSEIPASLETLVLVCLHKDPRSRTASARQLAEALRAILPAPAPAPQPAWWKHWLGWM